MHLRWLPRFVREAEGGAGGGATGGDPVATETAAAGGAGEAQAGPAEAGAGGQRPAARPDWLQEQFWDAERGEGRFEQLAKSYGEIRTAFSQKEEKVRERLLAEMREGVPESPEGYSFEIPKEAIPEGFEAVAPDASDPLLGEVRQVFHELGAKPEQWNRVIQAFVKWQVGQAPDMEAERARVGESAEQRIAAVDQWIARQVGDERLYRAVMDRATGADFVLAMERLMRSVGHAVTLPAGAAGTAGAAQTITEAEAREAMRHPDYYHEQRGAALRARVDAFIRAGGMLPGMRGRK